MKEIEMLSVLRPAAPIWLLSRKITVAPTWVAGLLLLLMFFLLTVLNSAPAFAQGSFTTNKPFLLSIDKTRHFTLTGIQVVYKPAQGSSTTGFLTLSGTPDNRSLSLFSDVHLSFSLTINGTPTVTDTFPLGVVNAVSTNLYCLASVGSSASGNIFNLYGGFTQSSASSSHAPLSHALSHHRRELVADKK